MNEENVIFLDDIQFTELLAVLSSIDNHLWWLNTVVIPGFCIILFGWWFLSTFLKRY